MRQPISVLHLADLSPASVFVSWGSWWVCACAHMCVWLCVCTCVCTCVCSVSLIYTVGSTYGCGWCRKWNTCAEQTCSCQGNHFRVHMLCNEHFLSFIIFEKSNSDLLFTPWTSFFSQLHQILLISPSLSIIRIVCFTSLSNLFFACLKWEINLWILPALVFACTIELRPIICLNHWRILYLALSEH